MSHSLCRKYPQCPLLIHRVESWFQSSLAIPPDELDPKAEWPASAAEGLAKIAAWLVGMGGRGGAERTSSEAVQRLASMVDSERSAVVAAVAERDCMICMSAPRATRFFCGHSVGCLDCTEMLQVGSLPLYHDFCWAFLGAFILI